MNDPAKSRWLLLGLLRGVGVVVVLLGLMVTEGRFDLPYRLGVAMLAVGFGAAFVAPRVLARRWRSPRP